MIHIGQKIEEIVRVKRFPIVEFARKINTTRNNVYNIFSRESIDTELLRKIGEILEFDFFQLLSKAYNLPEDSLMEKVVFEKPSRYKQDILEEPSLNDLVALMQKDNEHLKERLMEKEEIIELMKKVELFSKKEA